MRLSIKHSSCLASVLFFMACSSVPDGSPEEFHLAQASIDQAKDADVDDLLPNTLNRAKKTLSEAVDLYKKSDDKDLDRSARDQILREAAAKATEARGIADQSIALNNQVLAWDNKIEDHQSYQKMSQEIQTLREQIAAARQESKDSQANAQTQAAQGQTAMSGAGVKGPVAFFGVGETQVKGRFTESLASIADMLKKNTKAQVKLVGYTDSKGDAGRNRELSRMRAESVKNILTSMGVAENQIVIEGYGVDSSVRGKNAGDAQLARRVEASIVSGDQTEMSSR